MIVTKTEATLNNGLLLNIQADGATVLLLLMGKNGLVASWEIDPNDLNQLGAACGNIMQAAYGSPNADITEWSQIHKAIYRFRRRESDAERKGGPAKAPADQSPAVRSELDKDIPEEAPVPKAPPGLF